MNFIAINAEAHLSGLEDKITFERIDKSQYGESLSELLHKWHEPFVIMWHEDPEIGLPVLKELRGKGKMPSLLRGCVFFRGMDYAGLLKCESVKDVLKKNEFTEKEIHVVSGVVYAGSPGSKVLSRFEHFIDEVSRMDYDEAPLPFHLLEPVPYSVGLTLLLLAKHLIDEKKLSAEEVIAALDWHLITKDGRQAGYTLGLISDDEVPVPSQIIDYAHQYQNLLCGEARWRCDISSQRQQALHSMLERKVLSSVNYIKNSNSPNADPAGLSAIHKYVQEMSGFINSQLRSLTSDSSLIQSEGISRIRQYLKAESAEVLYALSGLIDELLKPQCHFYTKRDEIECQVNELNKVVFELMSQQTVETKAMQLHLGDITEAARKLESLLCCPCATDGNEVRLYGIEITADINC
jgi:hypothetical protein